MCDYLSLFLINFVNQVPGNFIFLSAYTKKLWIQVYCLMTHFLWIVNYS